MREVQAQHGRLHPRQGDVQVSRYSWSDSPLQEFGLKNLRTIHRLDRLTSGLLMFGRNPRKAREMEQQIRNRQVLKENTLEC